MDIIHKGRMENRIYLDNNATMPLRRAAKDVIMASHEAPLNASAVHDFGRTGRRFIEEARTVIAEAAGCPPAQLVFNSGATEGNNTVLQHFERSYPEERVLIGATEHPAVREATKRAEAIPVDENGIIDLTALETLLQGDKVSLVSVMLANNETGVLQPMAAIAALVHRYGALLHSDGAQALGRVPIDMAAMGIDFLTLSAHKVGGPQGVGALALGLCGVTPVLLHGGGQEKKARGGTENIAGIAGFGAAAQEALADLDNEIARLHDLHERLENGILDVAPEAVIFGRDVERLPNTSLFSVSGIKAETLLMALDLEGIAASNGSACSSGTVKASHVLSAMGVDAALAGGALRVSTGWATQTSDIDRFLEVWTKIYTRQKS